MSLRFKELRKSHISKAKLAEVLQVDVRTVTGWEQRNGIVPSLALAKEMAFLFGLETYDIYDCFINDPDNPDYVPLSDECIKPFPDFMLEDYKIKNRHYHGTMTYGTSCFAFGGIYFPDNSYEDGFIVMDANYNMIVFPGDDILSMDPVFYANGCIAYSIRTGLPVFEEMKETIQTNGSADVLLTLFGC